MLTIGDVKEFKARLKNYVDNIATIAVVLVRFKEGLYALFVHLVIDDADASVQNENI